MNRSPRATQIAIQAASAAALSLAAGHALAHAGHDHDGLAASLLHLLFGLHGWPTAFAWLAALTAAVAVGAVARRRVGRPRRCAADPARGDGDSRQAT
jgi:hypothetical protein